MEAAEKLFPPGNPYGVFSFGIDLKVIKGLPQDYLTLVVRVERKWREPTHPVPDVVFKSDEGDVLVQPDVIATGRRPWAGSGAPRLFTGLHPGAQTITGKGRSCGRGGIACLLTNCEGPTHFLTAGHLFPPDSEDLTVAAGWPGQTKPVICGRLVVNLLDQRPLQDSDCDAALVELTPEGVDMAWADTGGPVLEGIVHLNPGTRGAAQAFCPVSNDYSPVVEISYMPSVNYVTADLRNTELIIRDCLQTSQEITEPGDSGTILLTTGEPEQAIGSCIAGDGHRSLFEPLARSLPHVQTHVPNLKLWRR